MVSLCLSFVRSSMTKYCRLGGLNNKNTLSHYFGAWSTKIKVLVPSERYEEEAFQFHSQLLVATGIVWFINSSFQRSRFPVFVSSSGLFLGFFFGGIEVWTHDLLVTDRPSAHKICEAHVWKFGYFWVDSDIYIQGLDCNMCLLHGWNDRHHIMNFFARAMSPISTSQVPKITSVTHHTWSCGHLKRLPVILE
jgi:hypothetical protein